MSFEEFLQVLRENKANWIWYSGAVRAKVEGFSKMCPIIFVHFIKTGHALSNLDYRKASQELNLDTEVVIKIMTIADGSKCCSEEKQLLLAACGLEGTA